MGRKWCLKNTDREDALIAGLQEVMPGSHHMLCIWHINKNVLGRATKYFPAIEQAKAWENLWYKLCQALTLAEYEQTRGDFKKLTLFGFLITEIACLNM